MSEALTKVKAVLDSASQWKDLGLANWLLLADESFQLNVPNLTDEEVELLRVEYEENPEFGAQFSPIHKYIVNHNKNVNTIEYLTYLIQGKTPEYIVDLFEDLIKTRAFLVFDQVFDLDEIQRLQYMRILSRVWAASPDTLIVSSLASVHVRTCEEHLAKLYPSRCYVHNKKGLEKRADTQLIWAVWIMTCGFFVIGTWALSNYVRS